MKKPELFKLEKTNLSLIKKRLEVAEVLDSYEEQLKELFLIRNPPFRYNHNFQNEWQNFLKDHVQGRSLDQCGTWVYFPWNKKLAHYLEEELHLELRTARNKNIITAVEQKKLYDTTIAIAGLSVGSHPAMTLAIMGISKNLHIADPDKISGSNLNRIRADVTQIGQSKCLLIAQNIYQINPYANILALEDGVTDQNMEIFLSGVDVLVEEVDNLPMKIILREEAKKRKIPVIMATDNADNVIVDIERYDLKPNLKLFNGAAGDISLEKLKKMKPTEIPGLATKIAGPKFIADRMQDSLVEVGKTLYSWPQTGSAATLAGVAVAYTVKRLLLGQKLVTGKTAINLDAIFDPDYNRAADVKKREKKRMAWLKQIFKP